MNNGIAGVIIWLVGVFSILSPPDPQVVLSTPKGTLRLPWDSHELLAIEVATTNMSPVV